MSVSDAVVVERRHLLTEGARLVAQARQLDQEQGYAAAKSAYAAVDEVHVRYLDLLEWVTVARSRDSGELVRWPIDTVDLDGWFWDAEASIRRAPTVPATWLAMNGAMRLTQPVTHAPFMAMPGPAAPFVVPRLLSQPDVTAVIAQVPVGSHLGWPVTYFGPLPADAVLENEWGTDHFAIFDDSGIYRGRGETPPWPPSYDFDLAPWLEAGKLLWIAPGDASGTLNEGVPHCPYVGIEGDHGLAFVDQGTVRYWTPRT
jgi:hypothetical protein